MSEAATIAGVIEAMTIAVVAVLISVVVVLVARIVKQLSRRR